MIVIDDILLFPGKSLLFLLREIYNAAIQEMVGEADAIRQELSRLYLEFEAGGLSESEFDAREYELLDRLEALEESEATLEEGDEEGDPGEEDGEEAAGWES